MFKVVVIDDEPLVLEGLRDMVDWESAGFKLVGEALNGEEGYELISQVNPDLVITDMRMPVMDGIALMEKCRGQLDLKAKFVVLSGFSDFNYVKKALELKSLQYLLKPIDPDEIHQMLVETAEKITIERDSEEKTKQDLRFIFERSIKRVLEGDVKSSILGRIQFITNTSEDSCWLYGRVYNYDLFGESESSMKEKVQKAKALALAIGETLNFGLIDITSRGFGFIIYGSDLDMTLIQEKMNAFFEGCQMDNNPVSIMSTQVKTGLKQLCDSKREMDLLQQEMFYGSRYHIYRKSENTPIYSRSMPIISIEAMIEAIKNGRTDKAVQIFEDVYREARTNSYVPSEVISWTIATLRRLLNSGIMKVEGKEWFAGEIDCLRTGAYYTLGELKVWMRGLMTEVKPFIEVEVKNDPVDLLKTYVNTHYEQDIKIKKVAEVLGFNPVYMGQLFQKQTGKKYNNYVMDIRMEKAEELLKYSGLKIKEIAINVGYKNPDYFMLKFKETRSMSPLEYRKKYQ